MQKWQWGFVGINAKVVMGIYQNRCKSSKEDLSELMQNGDGNCCKSGNGRLSELTQRQRREFVGIAAEVAIATEETERWSSEAVTAGF